MLIFLVLISNGPPTQKHLGSSINFRIFMSLRVLGPTCVRLTGLGKPFSTLPVCTNHQELDNRSHIRFHPKLITPESLVTAQAWAFCKAPPGMVLGIQGLELGLEVMPCGYRLTAVARIENIWIKPGAPWSGLCSVLRNSTLSDLRRRHCLLRTPPEDTTSNE